MDIILFLTLCSLHTSFNIINFFINFFYLFMFIFLSSIFFLIYFIFIYFLSIHNSFKFWTYFLTFLTDFSPLIDSSSLTNLRLNHLTMKERLILTFYFIILTLKRTQNLETKCLYNTLSSSTNKKVCYYSINISTHLLKLNSINEKKLAIFFIYWIYFRSHIHRLLFLLYFNFSVT